MPEELWGFQNREHPELLAEAIRQGTIAVTPGEIQEYPQARPMYNRIWWATAKAEIAAATQGDLSTGFNIASGTGYLLKLNRDTSLMEYDYKEDGVTKIEKTIWNPFDSKIKLSTKIIFQVEEDRYGNFWVAQPVMYKPWCRFTLDAALANSDTYKAATIEDQWGYGFDHPSTSIDVYNQKTHTAGTFVYSGDSGDYGYAQYDPQNDKWWINPMECP